MQVPQVEAATRIVLTLDRRWKISKSHAEDAVVESKEGSEVAIAVKESSYEGTHTPHGRLPEPPTTGGHRRRRRWTRGGGRERRVEEQRRAPEPVADKGWGTRSCAAGTHQSSNRPCARARPTRIMKRQIKIARDRQCAGNKGCEQRTCKEGNSDSL